MTFFDNLSMRLANIIVCSNKPKFDYKPLPDMKDSLNALQDELEAARKEIQLGKIEWERTFDTLIDNVVLIGKDKKIIKVNKSFHTCIQRVGCPWEDLVGVHWDDFRQAMSMSNQCIVGACFESGKPESGIIDFNGYIFHVVVTPIVEHGEVVRVIRVTRDITEIEQQKRKLERRGLVLNAVLGMSKTLTNHDNWEDAMFLVLKELGTSLGVHRSYIYRNVKRDDRVCAVLTDVWVNPKKTIECNSKENVTECINYDHHPEWAAFMENRMSVQGTMANCEICPEKERCVCIQDVVVSAVPIYSNGQWWGFIGFDYHNGTKKWRCEDETLLKIAADILGGVIYHRDRYYETLQKLEGSK